MASQTRPKNARLMSSMGQSFTHARMRAVTAVASVYAMPSHEGLWLGGYLGCPPGGGGSCGW